MLERFRLRGRESKSKKLVELEFECLLDFSFFIFFFHCLSGVQLEHYLE